MNPPSLRKPTPIPMIGSQPAWRGILRRCGYPTDVVLIDFETLRTTDYSLSKLSTVEYVQDARYEEIAKSILHVRQPFQPIEPNCWRGDDATYIRYLQCEYGTNLEGCTVVAQNLSFDGLILALKYGINPPHSIDILGLARHENARAKNDLGTLAERFGLPPKGKTVEFKDIHLSRKVIPGSPPKMLWPAITPEQWGAMVAYANRDVEIEWGVFTRLLPRLSRPEFELRVMQHTLEMFWKPSFTVNATRAEEMKGKMRAEIDGAIAVTGVTKEEISGNNSFAALLGGALTEAGDDVTKYQKQGKPGKDGKPKALLAIAKDDEELDELKKHPSERVRQLMGARIAVKSWPLHIGRVESLVNQANARGGMLGVPLKYHGAHTGRWAGSDDINLQNLPSRSESELLNSIRTLLEAPPGHELVIVDQSQIEARVLAWIAGQEDLCQLFRDGSEIYCVYASKMVKRPLRKPKKSDPPALYKYLKRMRDMGKVQVLGGGYGMGWAECIRFALATYKMELTEAEARNLIKTYRDANPKITGFWGAIERAFKQTARYHHYTDVNGIMIHHEETGDLTVITLPNGRTLKYAGVKVSYDGMREQMWMLHPMTHKKIFLWGGTLTENVVQAMARDILAEWIMNTEDAGHHVALTVHDEIVGVVPEGEGQAALEEIIRIGSVSPAWAPDCPLGAEGKVSKRYEK